jgi:hypothetical protein
VDIDFVKWNGTDIKPVLELTGMMDEIQEAALRHCVSLFESTLPKPLKHISKPTVKTH